MSSNRLVKHVPDCHQHPSVHSHQGCPTLAVLFTCVSCSGPMVVIKQMVSRIWTTDKVTFADRISCSYFFFRFIYSAFLTVICLVCPAIVIWLDPWQWSWAPMMFLVRFHAMLLAVVTRVVKGACCMPCTSEPVCSIRQSLRMQL